MKALRITRRYGEGTYVLERGGRVLGSAYKSVFAPPAWLVQTPSRTLPHVFEAWIDTYPSLHTALRAIMVQA